MPTAWPLPFGHRALMATILTTMLAALLLVSSCADPSHPYARAERGSDRRELLAPPLGWSINPATRSANFTGAGTGEFAYLLCDPTGAAELFYWVPAQSSRSGVLQLVSGAEATALRSVRVEEDRATPPLAVDRFAPLAGLIVATTVPRTDRVFARFLETGELTVTWGARSLALDARPEQLTALEHICRRRGE